MKPDLNKFAEVSIENLEHFLTDENYPEFVKYLSDLAEGGDFEAAEKLFNAYFWGDAHTDEDQPKALALLSSFAEKNQSAPAARLLAEHYRLYVDEEGSDQRAVHWLQIARSLKDGESAYELGRAHYLGSLGLDEDEDVAAQYLEDSIDYGCDKAYSLLAKIYLKSEDEAKSNRGKERLTVGAKSGNAECQFELAIYYLTGEYFKKDARLGISWLFKASEQEYVDALIKLGGLYLAGDELDKDPYEGFRCFEKAARKHSKISQARLSSLYLLGVGVEKNLTLAHAWIRISELNMGQRGPANMSFTGEILSSNVLTEAQRKHSDSFVADFIKDSTWRYRLRD